jgi:hypothetical protein
MKKIVLVLGVCVLSTLSFFSGCVNVPIDDLVNFSIFSFDVEPGIINQGEFANLSWVVISASSVNIDNGIGVVALTGHRIIQPTQTTTYILTASNATTTKSATATITVKPAQHTQAGEFTDAMNDVKSIDYLTGETNVITFSPVITVANIDIIKATFTQQGTQATVSLQVKGNIENRGKVIDPYSSDSLNYIDAVEYGFQLTTLGEDYTISYSNRTGQLDNGIERINLTSSDFSVIGDTLTITFQLVSADETYEDLSVTSTFIKANYSNIEAEGLVYLSDVAPNPRLEIIEAYAPNTGLVGQSVQFNCSIAPLTGHPPYTYRWDFGDHGTSTQLNPTHVYTQAGYFTYTCTVTDQAGDIDRKSGTINIQT